MSTTVFIQWAGCVLGVAGSLALALNGRYAGWGFVAYLASNAMWIGYGIATSVHALVAQHLAFSVVSAIGIWQWLIKPQRAADQADAHRKVQELP